MNPGRAILFKIAAVFLFTVMSALIKAASETVPPGQTVFFRSACALPVIVAWLALRGELATGIRTRRPLAHLWRGAIGTAGMGMMFTGLALLPLPEVTAILYVTPLMIVIFAALFLGERLRLFRLSTVALGLVGIVIILEPRLSVLGAGAGSDAGSDAADRAAAIGALVTLGAALCAALAQISIRHMTRTEHTASIAFWFSVTAASVALLTMPFGWVWPGPGTLAMLVCAGLIGGVGQIFLTTSYKLAEAAVVAPFDYASILLALVIGYTVFGDVPTPQMLGGATLVMAAGGLVIWRERQLGLARARAARDLPPPG